MTDDAGRRTDRAQQPASDGTDRQRPVAISIRGVTKVFRIGTASKTLKERLLQRGEQTRRTFSAVNDVSFDIVQGETFGIIGHNGSGKSTLLKLMSGIMSPTAGDVLVSGRLAALLELGAGFHPDLTGAENIHLNGKILGFTDTYVRDVYDDIVGFAELEEFIETPVKHYSSGMRARLGFAVATHLEPDILLLDEILAVGDEAFKRKCMERVHRFRGLNRTMVLVSHSASTVAQLCDRSAVMSHGELLFVGESDEAINIHRRELSNRSADRADKSESRGAITAPASIRLIAARFGANGDEHEEPAFDSGADVTLLADVDVREPQPFRVRLSIRTEEGVVLVNRASTGPLGAPFDLPAGSHTISFTFHDLPLQNGRYIADVIVESPDGSRRFDRRGGAASFRVEGGRRGLGLVAVRVSCQIADDKPKNRRREDQAVLAEGAYRA